MAASRIGNRLKTALAAIGALTVTLVLLAVCAFFFAGPWLHDADRPEHADAIVVLAGAPERTMYAAELSRQGYAPIVYISRPVPERSQKLLEKYGFLLPAEETVSRAILLKSGVPEHAVRVFAKASVNTLEEARNALAAIPASSKTIMVVTSPFHARRVRMIFNKAFAQRETKLIVVTNPYEPYPERWWTEQESARQTILELTKVALYLLGGSYSNHAVGE